MGAPKGGNGHRWQPGQSGNPSGSSKKQRAKLETRQARKELTDKWDGQIDELMPKALQVIDKALDKNSESAARMILDRRSPVPRQRDDMVNLPELIGVPLEQQGTVIMDVIADGKLAPDVGKVLADIHSVLMRDVQASLLDEFIQRLEAGESAADIALELADRQRAA